MGVLINEVKIPGMMYADDIMLCSTDEDLLRLFEIILKHSRENKLEFSVEKSMIIPLHRQPGTNRSPWLIGVIPK